MWKKCVKSMHVGAVARRVAGVSELFQDFFKKSFHLRSTHC